MFKYVFGLFPKYFAPSGAKYREKGQSVANIGEGWSTNPFWDFQLLDQTRIPNIKGPKKQKSIDFLLFFRPFFQIFGPWRGQISRKGWVQYKHWRGVIDKPILELLPFGSTPDFLYKRPKKTIFPSFFHYLFGDCLGFFWVSREAALAADLITAWKPPNK